MQHSFHTIKPSAGTGRLSSQSKWDVGVSALLIRPRLPVKKHQAAAALNEPQPSPGCWLSMEQLWLSGGETEALGSGALSLSGLHPATRPPEDADCGSVARQRLRQADKRMTVVGEDDKALIYGVRSHALPCHQSVPLFLSLSFFSADPQLTNLTDSHLFLPEILLCCDCNLQTGIKLLWKLTVVVLWRVSSR